MQNDLRQPRLARTSNLRKFELMMSFPQMPSAPQPSKINVSYKRAQAKARVVRAFQEGKNWREVASANDLRGGLRQASVKLTVDVMSKIEELIDDDCRMTLQQLCDRILSDLGVKVSKPSIHRALQGMLYSTKRLRIEKATMNSTENKEKRKTIVQERPQPSPAVVVTDNAPAHSQVENLARDYLAEDGIVNLNKLVVLRLGPYSPMLNPIEGCWNSFKAKMRHFMTDMKNESMVRGEYDTYTAHRLALMKEAVEVSKVVITHQLVCRYERHCMRLCFAAENGSDMPLRA